MRAAPPLDPDRVEARRLLEAELSGEGYVLRESLAARAWRWFLDLFSGVRAPGELPARTTWVVLALVLLGVLAVLGFATRDRWRTGRLRSRAEPGAVLDGPRRTAAEHRAQARAALDAGDHGTAVLEAYRALTAGAIERTLLEDRPGSTAHEVAVGLTPVFPRHGMPLRLAADRFDAVRYGGQPADAEDARELVLLDETLATERPELGGGAAPAGAGAHAAGGGAP